MPNLKYFIQTNIDELIQITINERKDKGYGAMYVIFNETSGQVDCRYIELSHPAFNPELIEQFKKFEETNPSSIIYFILIEKQSCEIVQIDLDTRNK
jgi:hypothetical protein